MPRYIELPAEPKIVFGVFTRHGRVMTPERSDTAYDWPYQAGYSVVPYYGYGRALISADRQEVADTFDRIVEHWQRHMRAFKRRHFTLEDALIGRMVTSISPTSYHIAFHTEAHEFRLEPTRGWGIEVTEGPTQGPFVVRRVLADHRSFRLEDGRLLKLSRKIQLYKGDIPDSILDETFLSTPPP